MATADPPLRFGRFEINPAQRLLRIDAEPAVLGARAFDLLLALAQRRDRVVGKDELLDLVWPGLVVEEHNIAAQISSLRKLLGAQVIATIAGRGYRFVAPLDAASPDTLAGPVDRGPPKHTLPQPRTRFIGREHANAELSRLLANTGLLTLTGVGGSGKTRLALECARRCAVEFSDGTWFVDLAPLQSPLRVASACAAALGLTIEDESAMPERLAAHLADRQALIVLDNCEHVRSGAAVLADTLLARPGRTRVLATSREPLGVAGEQLYAVPPLSLPASDRLDEVLAADAARMFVDRARLLLPEFELNAGNAAAVADICRRLDGIALAIELAAARVPLLSVFDIAARLNDRFRLLTGGIAGVARQRTLAATMQWSYDALAPDEQRMLRLLSVFAGGCTLDAAASVADSHDDYAALASLSALHDKSLLQVQRAAGADGASRPRYGLLETVRQYARQCLDDCGETGAALLRHAGFLLVLAETAAPHLDGPQESLWMARLHAEHENLAAAMAWCNDTTSPVDPSWAVRLAAASHKYWLFNEIELGCRLLQGALERGPEGSDSEARFRALRGLAAMRMHRGQGEAGLLHARAALAVARRARRTEWQAMALNAIATCLDRREGDGDDGIRYLEQARTLAQSSGSAATLSAVLNNIAMLEFRRGRLDHAERGLHQALKLARGLGNVRSALILLHNLVRVCVAAGDPAQALAFADESEGLLRGVGEDVLKLELLEVSAGLASSRGEHEVAARLWGCALQRYVDKGYRRPAEDEAQLARLTAHSRQAIGDAAFDVAATNGRALDIDAAMAELRRWLNTGIVQAHRGRT